MKNASSPTDARILGTVEDACGLTLGVGVAGGLVLLGDWDDILGLSWELDREQTEQLAQLVVRASWEAASINPAIERNTPP